jgi:hypothetical protein
MFSVQNDVVLGFNNAQNDTPLPDFYYIYKSGLLFLNPITTFERGHVDVRLAVLKWL